MKGLPNKGATCYFNAALQCLLYCPNMTNYFLAGHDGKDVNPKRKGASTVATAFGRLARDYWSSGAIGDVVDHADLLAQFTKWCKGFTPGKPHDAHEAIVCLLDKIHDGLSRLKPAAQAVAGRPEVFKPAWLDCLKGSTSVVSEVFMGQVECTVRAPEGTSSTTYDHFTCLSLAVSESSSLGQCFQHYMAPERLDDFKLQDAKVEAHISKRFTYLPRVLVVHLKRFDGESKIDKFIDYPMELDLELHAAPGCDRHYQLFGVCLHRGDIHDGHYVACCEVQGRWHVMDDDAVVPMRDINNIIQRDAYVLLYKRL